MPKLHLKRTPEEEAAHRARKKKRKEDKKSEGRHNSRSSRKRAKQDEGTHPKWASSDEEPADSKRSGSSPIPHVYHCSPPERDHDYAHAEAEELDFREKLFEALGDDERLDGLETRLNDFAHVPDRWRTSGASSSRNPRTNILDEDEFLGLDPRYMDDDEYAEWVRLGMYR
jgi:hypothetical protein